VFQTGFPWSGKSPGREAGVEHRHTLVAFMASTQIGMSRFENALDRVGRKRGRRQAATGRTHPTGAATMSGYERS
jgi:hypothetical protein